MDILDISWLSMELPARRKIGRSQRRFMDVREGEHAEG